MPLFNFSLRPLDEIQPWGTAPDLSLSWFGLTDGIYWIDAGGEELFRYSDEIMAKWPLDPFVGPYVDYQVIRLYEDLIDILPNVLQLVPTRLMPFIQNSWTRPSWLDECHDWASNLPRDDEDGWDLANTATGWVGARSLTSLHLLSGPVIRIWSQSGLIIMAWDNTDRAIDGVKAWASDRGTYSLPAEDFRAEVISFHDRLMADMDRRIESILAHWARPAIRIDFEGLVKEHEYRRGVLESALRREPDDIDGDSIESAILQILGDQPSSEGPSTISKI